MHLPPVVAVTLAISRSRAQERARRARTLAIRRLTVWRERASFLWELRSFVRESLMAIVFSLVIVTLAGVLFGSLRDALLTLPGLILLVPGSLAMRGNIYASLGARLGTALHTGQLSSRTRDSPLLREEVLVVLVQMLLGAMALSIVGRIAAIALGVPTVSIVELAVTAVLGALIAGAIEMLITVEVAISAHRRGWDPDNVTAPVISAVADLISIPCLLGAAYMVVWMPMAAVDGLFITFLFAAFVLCITVARGGHQRAASVLTASIPVILSVLVIIVVPALVLEHIVEDLVETPTLLILLPPFVAMAGNLGAILASRLSSAAHLGLITLRGTPDPLVYKNLGVIALLSVLTFSALGGLVHGTAMAIGMGSPGLGTLVVISLVGGLVITGTTSATAYKVTSYTFVKGDDPDNVVIPVITSTMDALGTGLLVAMFMLMVF